MKVDINLLLSGETYEPRVGTQYEVAPGKWGTMKYPTIAFQQEVIEAAQEEGASDYSIMKLILSGVDDVKDADCIPSMPTQVVTDFFTLLTMIVRRLENVSKE